MCLEAQAIHKESTNAPSTPADHLPHEHARDGCDCPELTGRHDAAYVAGRAAHSDTTLTITGEDASRLFAGLPEPRAPITERDTETPPSGN